MSTGSGLTFSYLQGPPWDPCRFGNLNGQTCHEFNFYFEAERRIIIDDTQKKDIHCKYRTASSGTKYLGIGVLTYEDISEGFEFSGIIDSDFVTFPYCAETGDSITQCSKQANGPITLLIRYEKGSPSVANISGPKPASCAGNHVDPGINPAFFTDYDIQISPAEVKEGIRNGKMVDTYLDYDANEDGRYRLATDKGFLSIKFK
jgi:hypothetical protein